MQSWKTLYHAHREAITYVFFGGLTTLVSILSYAGLSRMFIPIMGEKLAMNIANLLAILLSITFAYVTNRRYVFLSKAKGRGILSEMASFYMGRAVTLILDMLLMNVLVSMLGMGDLLAKTLVTVVVVVLNYVIAKLFVFRGTK